MRIVCGLLGLRGVRDGGDDASIGKSLSESTESIFTSTPRLLIFTLKIDELFTQNSLENYGIDITMFSLLFDYLWKWTVWFLIIFQIPKKWKKKCWCSRTQVWDFSKILKNTEESKWNEIARKRQTKIVKRGILRFCTYITFVIKE